MLIYHKDPKGLLGKEKTILDTSISLFDNIKNNYPNGFNHEVTEIRLNGEKIDPLTYDLSRQATTFDEIVIVNRQQGVLEVASIISLVIGIAGAIATYLLMKDNDTTTPDTTTYSSNNTLTGQTNRARLYQAKPDIYGKIRAYPDIVNPASSEYIDNVMYVEHLFCIGVGEYDLSKIKYSDTLLKEISGTSYTIYNPRDVIPKVRYQFESADIDGIEITPPNLSTDVAYEQEYKNIANYSLTNGTATAEVKDGDDVSSWSSLSLPVVVHYVVNADITSEWKEWEFDEKGRNKLVTKTQVTNIDIAYKGVLTKVNGNAFTVSNVQFISYSKTYKGEITKTELNNSKFKLQRFDGTYSDAFNLPKTGSEIWVDLLFQNGLKGSVSLDFVYWQTDDNGDEIEDTRKTYAWSLSLNTSEQQYRTVKIELEKTGKYSIVAGRTNDGREDLADKVTVQKASMVSYEENYQVKDTLIYVKTKATTQALSLKELKFNAVAQRKVISYNTQTKQVDYTLRASRSFADNLLHTFVVTYGRNPSELDLDALYSIDAKLKADDERLGYFDYSFDDMDVSLGERIETICNAARVFVYRDGQKWRFARNEKKTRPAVMFNSLNLVSSQSGGTVQKKSSLPSSYDGVQIEYVNSSEDNSGGNDKKAFIDLCIRNKSIVLSQAYRPLKIALTGCRNYTQAMNRAQLEIRRLIYERTFVEDEAIADANLIDKGDLVLWADTYDETIAQGEIIKIDGKQFYVDQELKLDKSKTYRVSITDKYGYPCNWLEITSHDKVSFTADFNDAYIADNINVQMGSLFIITETVSAEPTEFLVANKQYQDGGSYKLNLIGYDPRIYEYD